MVLDPHRRAADALLGAGLVFQLLRVAAHAGTRGRLGLAWLGVSTVPTDVDAALERVFEREPHAEWVAVARHARGRTREEDGAVVVHRRLLDLIRGRDVEISSGHAGAVGEQHGEVGRERAGGADEVVRGGEDDIVRAVGEVDKEPAAGGERAVDVELELDRPVLDEVEVGEFQAGRRDDVGRIACPAGVLEFLGNIEFLDHCGLGCGETYIS